MFDKLDMVVLMVHNMTESIKFYQNLFGTQISRHSENWTTLALGNITIGLHTEVPETEDERPVKYGTLLTIKVKDVLSSLQQLEAKDAPVLSAPRQGDFGRYAEITDPDGHIIMLVEEDDL